MAGSGSDENLLERLARVRQQALKDVRAARSVAELDEVRRAVVGRSGQLLQIRRSIGSLPSTDRRAVGAALDRKSVV